MPAPQGAECRRLTHTQNQTEVLAALHLSHGRSRGAGWCGAERLTALHVSSGTSSALEPHSHLVQLRVDLKELQPTPAPSRPSCQALPPLEQQAGQLEAFSAEQRAPKEQTGAVLARQLQGQVHPALDFKRIEIRNPLLGLCEVLWGLSAPPFFLVGRQHTKFLEKEKNTVAAQRAIAKA